MNAEAIVQPSFESVAKLREAGFQGFRSVSQLLENACEMVPVERGVYIVVRDTLMPPKYLASSVGGRYRHQDPTVSVEALARSWVEGARVLYLGRAPGPGVRALLQQRIKRHIRFGHGRAVAAWGGRYLWQLRDHLSLLFAWMPTGDEDPVAVEARWLAAFVRDYGRLPFANTTVESGE